MAWKPDKFRTLANGLRFVIRGALLTCGIVISLSLVWLTVKLATFGIGYLNRTLFAAPWGQ